MRTRGGRIGLLALLAVLALVWAGPGEAKKVSKEQKAARLWSQIKSNLDADQELKACHLAVKMAGYEDTKAYGQAKKVLRKRGISIEDPLISYTSKAIVRAQNIVERDLLQGGDLKHIGIMPDHKDAWGTPLRVEMVKMGEYLYIVRSAGPDKKYNTGDDPIIGGLKPRGHGGSAGAGSGDRGKNQASGKPGKSGKTNPTLQGLLNQGGGSGGGSAGSGSAGGGSGSGGSQASGGGDETQPQEEVVDLGDLIEKTD